MSILSNNRFLQRVNPEIERARTDAGASLVSDHVTIQPLMRQMVDLGIVDNLKAWTHVGLTDTVVVGSDTLVPKTYDISGTGNDAIPDTEAERPGIGIYGFDFDGSRSLSYGTPASLNTDYQTIMVWINHTNANTLATVYNRYNTSPGAMTLFWSSSGNEFRANCRRASAPTGVTQLRDSPTKGTWHHISTNYNGSRFNLYVNGVVVDYADVSGVIDTSNFRGIDISKRGGPDNDTFNERNLNDIRIFNTALSTSQITSIYNATKGYYGIS